MALRLTTPRLVLRQLQDADHEALFSYRADPMVSRYQSWAPDSLEDARDFIRRSSGLDTNLSDIWIQLGITLKDSGDLIGDAGLHFFTGMARQTEIGLTVAPNYQKRGYASEALDALLDHLFIKMEKHRVFASTDPRNKPALALLEKHGLRREAHFRQSLWFKGEWADDLVYALLGSEWLGRRQMIDSSNITQKDH
jgi:RimJ/RimL family protein N-acetyltransferase